MVGYGNIGGAYYATEWTAAPSSTLAVCREHAQTGPHINDTGQVVGESLVGSTGHAVEWSGGSVIDLALFPSATNAINNAGQVVESPHRPEPSTLAVMLLGFVGLATRDIAAQEGATQRSPPSPLIDAPSRPRRRR